MPSKVFLLEAPKVDTATSTVDAEKRDEVERGVALSHDLEWHCFILKEALQLLRRRR